MKGRIWVQGQTGGGHQNWLWLSHLSDPHWCQAQRMGGSTGPASTVDPTAKVRQERAGRLGLAPKTAKNRLQEGSEN